MRNPREQKDVGGEKLVSRSLAMRPEDRHQPEAASRIWVRCSCECVCKSARVGRWESSLIKQRGQGGRRQLSHSVPRLRRKSQFALIQEPSPELVFLPNNFISNLAPDCHRITQGVDFNDTKTVGS